MPDMAETVAFSFPAPAKLLSLNDRRDRREQWRLIRIWREATRQHARATLGADFPRYAQARIDIEIAFTTRRVRDPGNWAPTAKVIVDALVFGRGGLHGLGILPDDDAAHLDGPYVTQADHLAVSVVPLVTVRITSQTWAL
jgi:hypothetical protein